MKLEFKKNLGAKVLEFKKNLGTDLALEVVQIGNDLASTKYISIKEKIAQDLGINLTLHKFDEVVGIEEIEKLIQSIKEKKDGLIFQLPIPDNLKSLVKQIPPKLDVDLLGSKNGVLWEREFLPPTIGAIDLVLKNIFYPELSFEDKLNLNLNLSGKNVVVIGQGILVGGPLLSYLKNRDATIISLNKYTSNTAGLTKLGDIVISAAGSPHLVMDNWLKDECVVIDASTSEENGHLIGDVDKDNLRDNLFLCPSPGGIGPITVLYLFYNLLKLKSINI